MIFCILLICLFCNCILMLCGWEGEFVKIFFIILCVNLFVCWFCFNIILILRLGVILECFCLFIYIFVCLCWLFVFFVCWFCNFFVFWFWFFVFWLFLFFCFFLVSCLCIKLVKFIFLFFDMISFFYIKLIMNNCSEFYYIIVKEGREVGLKIYIIVFSL